MKLWRSHIDFVIYWYAFSPNLLAKHKFGLTTRFLVLTLDRLNDGNVFIVLFLNFMQTVLALLTKVFLAYEYMAFNSFVYVMTKQTYGRSLLKCVLSYTLHYVHVIFHVSL